MKEVLKIQDAVHGLNPAEINDIVKIIDANTRAEKNLDKVTLTNIHAIIDSGCTQIRSRRQAIQQFNPHSSILEILSILNQGNEQAHAIQCAINPVVDAEACLGALAAKESTVTDSPDALYIKDFFIHNSHFYNLLAEIYKIDIARRIGNKKRNSLFFQNEISHLTKLAVDIHAALRDFVSRNHSAIQNLNHGERTELQKTIADVEKVLQNPDPAVLVTSFYRDVCEPLAIIARQDYLLHLANLEAAAQKVFEIEFSAEQKAELRTKVLEKVIPEERSLAGLTFDHGITSIPAERTENDLDYCEIETRASRLFSVSPLAVQEFLARRDEFSSLSYYHKLLSKAQSCVKKS